jgi:formylglycine-generating enzyme required for sulfatase activity
MGSPEDEEGRFGDEDPRHEVTVPERLAVGRYAVTFEEWDFANASEDWQRVTKLEPRMPDDKEWGRNRRPVINVSWEDAQAYIKWLRRKMGHDYRLLSEAEWEYCCRSGSQTRYCFGDEAERLAKYAWYDDNSGNQTHPVGERLANAWGLYDMHGNVWEWCEDVWHDSYADKPAELNETGSAWTAGGSGTRVLRGGSWFFNPRFLRSAYRFRSTPGYGNDGDGFRVARTLTS